ncbi:hypothetical protein [Vibrio sinensis]|uniref:hypothetical protein n=1 Tax=Vibrio sinensis TaxID=2302434 RepID=UPI001401E170|nr:hypothetical protein [Vibrio sinensis]
MTRLIAIVLLGALAFLLFRYRTNQTVQKWVIVTLISAFFIYTATLMFSEIIR